MSARRLIALAAVLAALAPARPIQAAETYDIDPAHSSVVFFVRHMGVSNAWGRFNEFSGTMTIDEADPSKSGISLEVKAASIDTNNEKRDDHLRSGDYFDAKQFPSIVFKSTAVRPAEGREDTFEVTGDLTLHGVTKTVTVPFAFFGTGTHALSQKPIAGGEATFTIKRSEFGMTKHLPNIVGDDVTIIVSVEAVKS